VNVYLVHIATTKPVNMAKGLGSNLKAISRLAWLDPKDKHTRLVNVYLVHIATKNPINPAKGLS
jgi:hypothetical protein